MDEQSGGARDVPAAAALRHAVDAMAAAGRGAAALGSARRRALLAEVDRASAVLTGVRAELLLAERDSGSWRGAGDPSFAAWRGRTTREGVRAGAAEERRAETMVAMPAMREAAVAGQVSVGHVDVLARTARAGSAAVRETLGSPEGQQRVLEMARLLDAGRFATALARLAARVDAAALERTHEGQRARRFVHLADGPDGTRITGRLDTMAGHRLRLALEAMSPRPAADDDRTGEQRRADALVGLADKVLSLPDTIPGAAQRPHVSFLMTADTWAALRRARQGPDAGHDDGCDDGRDDDGRGTPPAIDPVTLEDGTPVPLSEVARALCDCELTRIVLDAAAEPVDLGRTARTYTGTQRRAVIARDGGCAWDGCAMAPRWLEVHHGHWWDRDTGPTSVANGVAVCSFHHHEIHRLDLTVARLPLAPEEAGVTTRRVRYLMSDRDGHVVAGRPPGEEADARRAPTRATSRGDPPVERAGPGRSGPTVTTHLAEQLPLGV